MMTRRLVDTNGMGRALMGLFLVLATWAGASSRADAAGDASAGRDIAVTWCSACHLVEGHSVATTEARPLAAVARDRRWTAERLRGFLTRPHNRMPDLNLTTQEIENLIAYLQSLKQ